MFAPLYSSLVNRGRLCLKKEKRMGMVAYACNPSALEGQGRQITGDQEFKTRLANMVKPHLYKKYRPGVGGLCLNPSNLGG